MQCFQGYRKDEWIRIRKARLNPRQVEGEGNLLLFILTTVMDGEGDASLITFRFCSKNLAEHEAALSP